MSDSPVVHREAFWLLCDNVIGNGMSRQVYDSSVFKDSVVKIENRAAFFQNVVEWETWNRVKDTDFAKWFAPCEWISPSGTILVMKKTFQMLPDNYPDKMPAFFTDFKYANYGWYNGHIVCHDYGTSLIFENGMTKRLKKADWWDS